MISGVIFDLDGTLLDTLDDLAFAVNTALAERGLPQHETAAYRLFVGNGMETLVKRAAPDNTGPDILGALVSRVREIYAKCWARTTHPYAGINEMLKSLCQKIPMAVLSNKPHEFTVMTVQHFFPETSFSIVQGSLPGKVAKPDPELALRIAGEWKLPASNIMFVGDSSVDMKTAIAAGMVPVGVLWGFRDKAELVACKARVLLQHPHEIYEALQL